MNKWQFYSPVFDSDKLNHFLKKSPWSSNRLFTYDFICNIRPRTIVELGTHYGCSLFTFCQSIKDQKLKTKIYAIDTWVGDSQAGYYDESVLVGVRNIIQKKFSKQKIFLIQKLFSKAIINFKDESIDLLHIDGLHTYKAVKEDFESWLPKLNKNGIIFFHDIGELAKIKKYGSVKFWNELKKNYPYFEFLHNWGLGIIFPKGNIIHNNLLKINFKEKIKYYEYLQRFLYEKEKTKNLIKIIKEKDICIKNQTKLIDEKDIGIRNQTKLIDERNNTIKNQNKIINELKKIINNYNT